MADRVWSWRAGVSSLLVAALVALCGPAAVAQSGHADPGAPSAEAAPAPAVLESAVGVLGESPIAAILEAAGPDVREFNDHITTLANPFFEGRAPGVRGNALAADYIEYYFRKAGLSPAFASEVEAADGTAVLDPGTSYRQSFQAGSAISVTRQAATLELGGGGTVRLEPGKDFTVLGMSGTARVRGPVVFAGYSIADGVDGYSSYPEEHADLKGKVALIFRFEPMDAEGRSKWAKVEWSPDAALERKVAAAAERGAAGIIVVSPPGAADPRGDELASTQSTRSRSYGVPVVMVGREVAERLVGASEGGVTLAELRHGADEEGGVRDLQGVEAALDVAVKREAISTDNVGAVLAGRGALKDEYVVVGAHYDHVGFGPVGVERANQGKLHPGADDNASGTAALLVVAGKLARAYAELPADADARSIAFVAFSAEEMGLIGSRRFVASPPMKLEKIDLMVNMDMVGRLRASSRVEVEGTQSAEGLYESLAPHFERSGLPIKHGSAVAQNSDHAPFYNKKIPVLFFFTGLHRDYHKPGDVASKINHLGAARVAELVHEVTLAAAQRPGRLVFAPGKKEQASPGPLRSRVRFGIAPGDYGDEEPGVLVGDVTGGTSAADAGVKAGDRLIRWNGKEIADVESWMPMLASHEPGDVVDVTVRRGGEEIVLKVTLKPGGRADH